MASVIIFDVEPVVRFFCLSEGQSVILKIIAEACLAANPSHCAAIIYFFVQPHITPFAVYTFFCYDEYFTTLDCARDLDSELAPSRLMVHSVIRIHRFLFVLHSVSLASLEPLDRDHKTRDFQGGPISRLLYSERSFD